MPHSFRLELDVAVARGVCPKTISLSFGFELGLTVARGCIPKTAALSFGSELGHALDCPINFRLMTLPIGIKFDVTVDGRLCQFNPNTFIQTRA